MFLPQPGFTAVAWGSNETNNTTVVLRKKGRQSARLRGGGRRARGSWLSPSRSPMSGGDGEKRPGPSKTAYTRSACVMVPRSRVTKRRPEGNPASSGSCSPAGGGDARLTVGMGLLPLPEGNAARAFARARRSDRTCDPRPARPTLGYGPAGVPITAAGVRRSGGGAQPDLPRAAAAGASDPRGAPGRARIPKRSGRRAAHRADPAAGFPAGRGISFATRRCCRGVGAGHVPSLSRSSRT